jgi:hypothetical protein
VSLASEWTIAKDALSFAGSILVAIPWFFDFVARVQLERLKNIRSSMRSLKNLISHRESWLASPKFRDLMLTFIGLCMITVSFGIALMQSLGWLGIE